MSPSMLCATHNIIVVVLLLLLFFKKNHQTSNLLHPLSPHIAINNECQASIRRGFVFCKNQGAFPLHLVTVVSKARIRKAAGFLGGQDSLKGRGVAGQHLSLLLCPIERILSELLVKDFKGPEPARVPEGSIDLNTSFLMPASPPKERQSWPLA